MSNCNKIEESVEVQNPPTAVFHHRNGAGGFTTTLSILPSNNNMQQQSDTILLFANSSQQQSELNKWIPLFVFYGSIPTSTSSKHFVFNGLCYVWYAVTKLALVQFVVYITLLWIYSFGQTNINFELVSAIMISVIFQGIPFIIPQWWKLMNPLLNGLLLQNEQNLSTRPPSMNARSISASTAGLCLNEVDTKALKMKQSTIWIANLFFLYSVIWIASFVILFTVSHRHTTFASIGRQEYFPIVVLGNFFHATAQTTYLAHFIYRVKLAESLISNALNCSDDTENSLILRDIEHLREQVDALFSGSAFYTLDSLVFATSFLGSLMGIIRIFIEPDIFGFLTAMCYYGRAYPIICIMVRYMGEANSLFDAMIKRISTFDVEKHSMEYRLQRTYLASNLQATPLFLGLVGFKPTRETYKWQVLPILLTCVVRLLQVAHHFASSK